MKSRVFAALVGGFITLGAAIPMFAHHSFAASYDLSVPITVQGTITQVLLRNPHSWFRVNVKDANGNLEEWSFEAGTPSGMIRNGYKPDVIKTGTEVIIKGFRSRDASQKRGMLRELTTPGDGKTYGMFGPQESK